MLIFISMYIIELFASSVPETHLHFSLYPHPNFKKQF